MCSVSLLRFNEKLLVTMNRDERRERHEAGLFVDESQIYPIDSHAGGTWCGANKHGLIAALLNRYQDAHKSDGTTSRGTLIPLLLEQHSLEDAGQYLAALSLESFNPFTLILSDRIQTSVWSWNGVQLGIEDLTREPFVFFSSSSIDADKITAERSLVFKNKIYGNPQTEISAEKILTVHASRNESTHSRAILMDRDVSHTKSIVQMTLNPASVAFDYYDESALTPVREGVHSLPLMTASTSLSL